MNDEQKLLARIITYMGLFLSPITGVLLIWAYKRDLKLGLNPSGKHVYLVEIILVSYMIFAIWLIRRMNWDFWRKDKPKKIKLSSSSEKWSKEKN